MTGGYQRPQLRLAPSPTAESLAFWTGGRNGELLITGAAVAATSSTRRGPPAGAAAAPTLHQNPFRDGPS